MKKAMILGFVVLFALGMVLVACGEEEETTTTTAPPESTTTSMAEETTTTTSAEGPAQEPITLKMAYHFQENETGGKIAQHFADYIEDKTGGTVTFELFPGGTLGGPPESLDLVSSGSVDMVPLGHPAVPDKLPLLNFPMWAPATPQDAVDYFNTLVFEDPATSALIQAEATALNIKYLGFTAGGANVFMAKEPWEALADLAGKKIAVGGSIPAFEALGFVAVQSFPPDTYENLSRGVADCAQMGFAPTVFLKWYDAAPYYRFDGTYAAGNPWTIYLPTWEKLSAETQQIFMDAAEDAEAYSLTLDAEETTAGVSTIEGAGGTVGELTAEDKALWWDTLFATSAADCMTRAEAGGFTADMITVLTKAAEITGATWSPPAP